MALKPKLNKADLDVIYILLQTEIAALYNAEVSDRLTKSSIKKYERVREKVSQILAVNK